MVPVQKIHGEQNGSIRFTDLSENKMQEVKSNGWHMLKAASNKKI